jgi:hypothetical protein
VQAGTTARDGASAPEPPEEELTATEEETEAPTGEEDDSHLVLPSDDAGMSDFAPDYEVDEDALMEENEDERFPAGGENLPPEGADLDLLYDNVFDGSLLASGADIVQVETADTTEDANEAQQIAAIESILMEEDDAPPAEPEGGGDV